MKSKRIVLSIIFFFTIFFSTKQVNAQHHLSFSLSQPVTIGDSFFSNYDGLVGLNLEYSYPLSDSFMIGGKIGYSRAQYDLNMLFPDDPPTVTTFTNYSNLYTGQVIISSSILLDERLSFKPLLGVGYATSDFKGNTLRVSDDSGINSSFSLSLDLLLNAQFKVGTFSSYQYIHLGEHDNVHLMNSGVKLTYLLN